MSRSPRLIHVTLTGCVAYLLLSACSEGTVDDDGGSPGVAGSTGLPAAGGSSSGTGGRPATAGSSGASNTTLGGTAGKPATGGSGGVSAGANNGGSAGATNNGGVAGMAGASSGGAGTGGGGTGGAAAGSSGEPTCDGDEELCSGQCVDVTSSAQHCGECGDACGANQACVEGECECTGEGTLCGNSCVDTESDEQNCGGCDTECDSGEECTEGECTGGDDGGGEVTGCTSIGDGGEVSSTIVVKNGQTYDGQCRRFRADPDSLGDGSQKEGQKPVFRVEDGGRLINVVLGAPAADGIHTEGDVTLENITWEDIGEDALTVKESGTVVLNGGSATNGADKVFQINAAATFRVSNFKASNAGKFIRQNGGSGFKVQVFIDRCDISDMSESIFRTDSSSSTVSMTNTRYSDIGNSLFMGVSGGNITESGNTEY
jgi:hypothetical protein